MRHNDYNERSQRLNAINKNAEWLQEHDLDENYEEAIKRLNLIVGDARGLERQVEEQR